MSRMFAMAWLLGLCLAPPAWAEPSLEEKIGQMLMVGFRGDDLAPGSQIAADIAGPGVGGIVLYEYNFFGRKHGSMVCDPERLRRFIRRAQQLAKTPLFVALDYEGGQVNRLGPACGLPVFKSAEEMGRMRPEACRQQSHVMGRTLHGLGINLDLAPVVDLNLNPQNPVIGKIGRSFSADPGKVVERARIMISALHENGVLCTLKHFPGQGSARSDSHLGLPDVTDTWNPAELAPYRALIRDGVTDAVMTAHVLNRRWDSQWPATLSPRIIRDILRGQLGFEGVVISDDLQMAAILGLKQQGRPLAMEDIIRRALEADVDILLFSNGEIRRENTASQAAACIQDLVRRGAISETRIDRSYARIMALKRRLKSAAAGSSLQ